MFRGIDFYSDTMTRPCPSMRRAMAEAEVGDEQKGEDPTTLRLEERVAELMGSSSAMFFPSATMANEIAILLHCQRGDELIASHDCHLFIAEAGGPAVHAGALAKPIKTKNGVFSASDLRENINGAKGPHYPVSSMVSVENTTNMGGGVAWTLEQLSGVVAVAKEFGLKTHMDGARFFHAAVKTGASPSQVAKGFDTVTICLSKGLGCATGAVLTFDKAHWEKVRRLKQLMGGAMRQSGFLAAAGLYALDHNINRMADDHENARLLAEQMGARIRQVSVETTAPSTNMVFFSLAGDTVNPNHFNQACAERGLRFSRVGENRFRAVTHLDIKRSDIDKAVGILADVFSRG